MDVQFINDKDVIKLVEKKLVELMATFSEEEIGKINRKVAKENIFQPLKDEVTNTFPELAQFITLSRDKKDRTGVIVAPINGKKTIGKHKTKIGGFLFRWFEHGTEPRYRRRYNNTMNKAVRKLGGREAVLRNMGNMKKGYTGVQPKRQIIIPFFQRVNPQMPAFVYKALLKVAEKTGRA